MGRKHIFFSVAAIDLTEKQKKQWLPDGLFPSQDDSKIHAAFFNFRAFAGGERFGKAEWERGGNIPVEYRIYAAEGSPV